MTAPSLNDFIKSSARWHGTHLGIAYQIAWWGSTTYQPHGTWNWYILVNDEQFYSDDWDKLRLKKQDQNHGVSWYRHWSYEDFPDLNAHGGWTFGELKTYLGRDGKEHELVKVGCDYNHAFDRDMGYSDDFNSVERDVKRSIELLAEMFPRCRLKCAYSGKYGDAEEFYTATNGLTIHKSNLDKIKESGWEKWLPITESTP